MAHGPLYHVKFRRRREGRTDYRRRLALLKSGKARVVVRRSNRNVTVQFVHYSEAGDVIVSQAQATELKKLGWNGHTSNTPAAYLAGLLAGKRYLDSGNAVEADEEENHAVLDLGRQVPKRGGLIFAALAGVLESGVRVPHGGDVLPADERIRGEHLPGENRAAAFAATFEQIMGRAPASK